MPGKYRHSQERHLILARLVWPLAVMAGFSLLPHPATAATIEDVNSLSVQQQEQQIDACARRIEEYNRTRATQRQYSPDYRDELLRCIEVLRNAAEQPVQRPNTIFR